jgi:hypothetical protein
MRRIIVAAVVINMAALIAFTRGSSRTYANPVAVWVLNLNVVNASTAAAGCTAPHNCDLTTTADRAALLSNFGTLQTQSGGKVEQEPSGFVGTPTAGFTYILVQANGLATAVYLNGRGLTCTPACDALTKWSTDPIDHYVAYKITDTGSHNVGDTLVATAIQDAVSLDSITITVVPPPPSVGGVAEQPDVVASIAHAERGDDVNPAKNRTAYAFFGIALAVVVAFGAAGWYVRWKRAGGGCSGPSP